MEEKKIIPGWLSVVVLVLTLGAFLLNIVTISEEGEYAVLRSSVKVVFCFAYAASLLYCLSGYKKDGARYFHGTAIIYAVAFMLSIVVRLYTDTLYFDFLGVSSVVAALAEYGIMCIFAVAKDLGRRQSFLLAGANLFLALYHTLSMLRGGFSLLVSVAGEAILALVFIVMLYAKYEDKTARGTK